MSDSNGDLIGMLDESKKNDQLVGSSFVSRLYDLENQRENDSEQKLALML